MITEPTPATRPATARDRRNIDTVEDSVADPAPAFHPFRYDASGLRGRRMRLITDLPTNDAGDPQEGLIGRTDVICLDDTPSVFHSLRVHPVGEPEAIATVGFDQLALYDDQP